MNTKYDCVVDQNGVMLFPEQVPATLWKFMAAFPFTIEYDEKGQPDYNISVNPQDYDPRGKPNMTAEEFKCVTKRTRVIVESMVQALSQKLISCSVFESLLDEAQLIPFYPEFFDDINSFTNTEMYFAICDFVITMYAELQSDH